jgi:hypothetical protein
MWALPLGIWGEKLEVEEILKWLMTDPPRCEAPKVSPIVT